MGAMPNGFDGLTKREMIKAMLRSRGSSLSKVARELDLKPSTISSVLAGSRSLRVERAIAEVLQTTPEKIWPERYPE